MVPPCIKLTSALVITDQINTSPGRSRTHIVSHPAVVWVKLDHRIGRGDTAGRVFLSRQIFNEDLLPASSYQASSLLDFADRADASGFNTGTYKASARAQVTRKKRAKKRHCQMR